MSTTVDSRVVEMSFDNKNFESNVKTSLGTLDKLKRSLNLEGSTKGLEDIDAAAKHVNLNALGEAAESVRLKFSALEVMATTALANITNSAINAGKNLIKSLSIDQITAGWSKYEQKTASVQTLVNSTGKSMEEIDEYLAKLMWFSDETSYSFTDMTSALAQMTSAGGDIDKLMPMITGIANATAFAGKGATEFASTIRNLAQSYQAGFLQLQDMKSLNLMGTSSKQLKETFISVAESMGKIIKGSVTLENFDTTLSEKWADTEVMEKALGKFSELSEAAYAAVAAGEYNTAAEAIEALAENFDELAVRAFKSAQEAKTFREAIDATKDAVSSGWLQSFEIIFGNYEEAKELWTDLANGMWEVFASGAEARNELLQGWKDLGGRDDLIEGFKNAIKGIAEVVAPVKEAFRQIFPPKTSNQLADFTAKIKELTSKMTVSEETAEKIKNTFKGLFSLFNIGKQAIFAVISGLKTLSSSVLSSISPLGGKILDATSNFGVFLTRLDNAIAKTGIFKEKVDNIVQSLINLPKAIDNLFRGMTGLSFSENFTNIRNDIYESMTEMSGMIDSKIKEITGISIANIFSDISDKITNAIQKVKDFVDKSEGIDTGAKKIMAMARNYVFEYSDQIDKAAKKVKDIPKNFVFEYSDEIEKASNKMKKNIKNYVFEYEEVIENADESVKSAAAYGVKIRKIFSNIKANMSEMLTSFTEAHTSFKPIVNLFEGLKSVLSGLWQVAKNLTPIFLSLADSIGNFFKKIGSAISNISNHESEFKPIISLFDGLKAILNVVWQLIKNLTPIFLSLAENIGKALQKIGSAISNTLSPSEFDNVLDLVNSGVLVAIALGIKNFIDGIGDVTGNVGSTFGKINQILDSVKESLESWQNDLKSKTLLKIAEAIGIITLSLVVLSMIDSEKLTVALTAMSAEFLELMAAFKMVSKIDTPVLSKTAGTMLAMAGAILVLTLACKALSKLNWDEIFVGLVGVAVLSEILVLSAKQLSSNSGEMIKGATGLIAFAIAINLLVKPVKELGKVNIKELAKGLVSVGVLCAELAVFMKVAKFDEFGVEKGIGLIAIAVAINILAIAVKKFGELDLIELTKGIVAVGLLLTGLGVFTKLTANAERVISTSTGLVILGAAMLIFAKAVEKFGALDLITLAKGLGAMAIALTIAGLAIKFIPNNAILIGTGLVIVGAALNIIAKAVKSFGGMSLEEIGKGLLVMAGSLALLSVALIVMKSTLAGSAALLVAASALAILCPVIKSFSKLSLKEIGMALLTLAGALAVIGVAGLLLGPIVPALLGLGAAVALLGVGALACGAGLLLLSTALSALAISGTAGVAALVFAIEAIIGLIPQIIVKVGEGLIELIKLIGNTSVVIFDTIVQLGTAVIGALNTLIPQLVTLLVNVLATLAENLPTIIQYVIDMLITLLEKIRDNIGPIVTIVIDIIIETINAITEKIPDIVQAGIDLILGFIDGLSQGLVDNAPRVRDSLINLVKSIFEALLSFFGLHTSDIVDGVKKIGTKALDKIKEFPDKFKEIGKNIIEGLKEGISNAAKKVVEAAKGVVSDALEGAKKLLGIHSPSKEFAKVGMYSDMGMVQGLNKYSGLVSDASENVGETAVDSMSKAISKISDRLDSEMETDPTIRPVLDLSDITDGVGQIDDMLYSKRYMQLAGSVSLGNSTNNGIIQNASKSVTDGLVGEFNNLRKDVSDLTNAITRMKIVMDTGTVVGALVSDMDAALGNRAVMVGRRV